jgi:hypothetical protein
VKLPADIPSCHLHSTSIVDGDGNLANGFLILTPPADIYFGKELAVSGRQLIAVVDGSIDVTLPANTGSGMSRTNWPWELVEDWAGGRTGELVLESGDTDYADLVPAPTGGGSLLRAALLTPSRADALYEAKGLSSTTQALLDGRYEARGSSPITFSHTGFAWYEAGATNPDSYAALDASGVDAGNLSGNTGYERQRTGLAADHAAQSRMRRCVLADDASAVAYYLDCDDSTKIAGSWDGSAQVGWVRVYEGALDPVRPTPGQTGQANAALRDGIADWDSNVAYAAGDRVLYDDALWDSLSDGNFGIVPAAGTADADLTGGDGQVMVEIPAFYYRADYDASTRRHSYEILFDPADYKPFPDLTSESDAAATLTLNSRDFALHPAFRKASKHRRARYHSAFGVSATDTTNNTTGVLRSIADGTTENTTNVSPTNFRAKARNRNVGLADLSGKADDLFSIGDYWLRHALLMLFFTEYRTFSSQSVVGGGNISGGNDNKVAGRSAPMGNTSGVCDANGAAQTPTTGTFDAMTWRGVEDFWGTAWQWMDGWNIRNGASATENYIPDVPTPSSYGYGQDYGVASVDTMKGKDAWQYPEALAEGTFLPVEDGGSSTTYLTDGYYGNPDTDDSWRAARVGATASAAAHAGAAAVDAYGGAADHSVGIGVALAC